MSSYYDDPDFADEYRRRDEEALDDAISEREREIDVTTIEEVPPQPLDVSDTTG